MSGERDRPTPVRERSQVEEPDLEPTEVELRRDADAPAPESPAELEQPGGLLGLLLWPMRAAISLALKAFAALVQGVLGAFLPASRKPDEPDDGPAR